MKKKIKSVSKAWFKRAKLVLPPPQARYSKYHFDRLAPGGKPRVYRGDPHRIMVAAHAFAKRNRRKFATRLRGKRSVAIYCLTTPRKKAKAKR